MVGATAGSGLLFPSSAQAEGPGIGLVLPIPTTEEFIPGVLSQVHAPPYTGVDSDPSTEYNFQGASAIAFSSGTVERRDRKTGDTRTLPFSFSDMRFMQGTFRGRDGHAREATFGFI